MLLKSMGQIVHEGTGKFLLITRDRFMAGDFTHINYPECFSSELARKVSRPKCSRKRGLKLGRASYEGGKQYNRVNEINAAISR